MQSAEEEAVIRRVPEGGRTSSDSVQDSGNSSCCSEAVALKDLPVIPACPSLGVHEQADPDGVAKEAPDVQRAIAEAPSKQIEAHLSARDPEAVGSSLSRKGLGRYFARRKGPVPWADEKLNAEKNAKPFQIADTEMLLKKLDAELKELVDTQHTAKEELNKHHETIMEESRDAGQPLVCGTVADCEVNPTLEPLLVQVLLESPVDPVPFMIKWLANHVPEDSLLEMMDKVLDNEESRDQMIENKECMEAGGAACACQHYAG